MKKFLAILFVFCLVVSQLAMAEGAVLNFGETYAYASLDVHKDYNGWYTNIYGISETLFRMDNACSAQPYLVESCDCVDTTWTIVLKDGVSFSNGDPLTADMAVRNLKRIAEVNDRFTAFGEYEINVVDEKTFTITTPKTYPTLKNDLASPEMGMIDLDATTDFDNAPVCTGPFVIDTFVPEGDVSVVRNDNYWGGEVKLAGANFYYLHEDEPKQMAMEAGEIQGYTSVTASALEVYESEPETYQVFVVPATRLQLYVLNENRLSDSVRQAINLVVDNEAMAAFLNGTVTPAVGMFSASTAYGQVTVPETDVAKAQSILESEGYALNANGVYEKDGQELSVDIAYYAARSLDKLAVLMQEQLANAGIKSTLSLYEDADSSYVETGDFDIGFYCSIVDRAGDPYAAINGYFRQNSRWSIAGFKNDECEALIAELECEPDTARRAELANQIVQIVIDDNAFGFIGLFNKTTVLAKGVSGFAEECPFDFYGIDANTTIEE